MGEFIQSLSQMKNHHPSYLFPCEFTTWRSSEISSIEKKKKKEYPGDSQSISSPNLINQVSHSPFFGESQRVMETWGQKREGSP